MAEVKMTDIGKELPGREIIAEPVPESEPKPEKVPQQPKVPEKVPA